MISKINRYQKLKKLGLFSNRLVQELFVGNYRSVFKGPGLEFDEVRDYVYGDAPKMIDWNVTARIGTPYVKTFREERELCMMLVADVSASMHIGSINYSKIQLLQFLFTILGLTATSNQDRVGSVFFDKNIHSLIPARKGLKHLMRQINVLEFFAQKKSQEGSDLSSAIKAVRKSMRTRGICIIISDFRTHGYERDIALLAHKHDVIALKVSDILDRELPSMGLTNFIDSESNASYMIYSSAAKLRHRYKDFWQRQDASWRQMCKRLGVDYIEIATVDNAEKKLLEFFTRRRRYQKYTKGRRSK